MIHGKLGAVNPQRRGTKVAAHYLLEVPPRSQQTVCLRLCAEDEAPRRAFGPEFDRVFEERSPRGRGLLRGPHPAEPQPGGAADRPAGLRRAAVVEAVLPLGRVGVAPGGPPPAERRPTAGGGIPTPSGVTTSTAGTCSACRTSGSTPAFFAWDLAFHMLPLARIDPEFAKHQLLLFLREWYMHPNGQLPAFEYDLSNVNPPVHAYACWRVYKISAERGAGTPASWSGPSRSCC